MAGDQADRAARAAAGEAVAPGDLLSLAACHRLCLPETANSRAGIDILAAMYRALARDARSRVIWRPGAPEAHLGGFAAGTIDLRATEAHIRRELPLSALVKMGIRALGQPAHLVARRRWEKLIPSERIGYVLTLGTARAVADAPKAASGTELMDALEAWFAGNGCTESWVDTEAKNERALEFYRKRGYVERALDLGQVLLAKTL
jgi:GNAT superfamily N-acetyltransferase